MQSTSFFEHAMVLLAGVLNLGFALFHLAFWRLFHWPERLRNAGELNSAITQTLNVMLTFVFFSYGCALVWDWARGVSHPLMLAVGFVFWTLRAVLQFVWFNMRYWQSKAMAAVLGMTLMVHGLAALS